MLSRKTKYKISKKLYKPTWICGMILFFIGYTIGAYMQVTYPFNNHLNLFATPILFISVLLIIIAEKFYEIGFYYAHRTKP